MGMKSMYDLRDMLCKELDEITRKGELGAGDLDIVHKLTDTIKNIDKIEAMEEDGYSSRRDEYDMRGRGRRGTHYVRGHYSRDGGIDNMKRQLQEMLDNADGESIRRAIQRCMDTIEG